MFFVPLAEPKPPAPRTPVELPSKPPLGPTLAREEYAFPSLGSNVPRGWVDPLKGSIERLKVDAEEAAKAYRKPGRSGRLGPGGRR